MGGLQKIQESIYKSHAYLFWPPFKNDLKFPILIKVKCCQVNTVPLGRPSVQGCSF